MQRFMEWYRRARPAAIVVLKWLLFMTASVGIVGMILDDSIGGHWYMRVGLIFTGVLFEISYTLLTMDTSEDDQKDAQADQNPANPMVEG